MSTRTVYGEGWPPVRSCTCCMRAGVQRNATHFVHAPDGLQSFACAAHARGLAWARYNIEPIGVFFENCRLLWAFSDLLDDARRARDTVARLGRT